MRSLVRSLPLLAALAPAALACSGAPNPDQATEKSGTVEQDVIVTQRFTMTATQFSGLVNQLLRLDQFSVQMTDGVGYLYPSQAYVNAVYPDDPSIADHAQFLRVPNISVPMPDPFPAGAAHLQWLNLTGVTASMGNGEIDIDGTATGSVLVVAPIVAAFSVVLDSVSVHVALGATGTPSLTLNNVSVNTQYHVQGCLGGLCDGIVPSFMPDLNAKIHDAIVAQLGPYLTTPAANNAVNAALDGYSLLQAGGQPWQVVPNSFYLGNQTAYWLGSHLAPPQVPSNCVAWATCGNGAGVHCDGQPEQFVLSTAAGPVARITSDGSGPVYLYDPGQPAGVTSQNYSMCATNPAGTQCTQLSVKLDPTPCTAPAAPLQVSLGSLDLQPGQSVSFDVQTHGWANVSNVSFSISGVPSSVTATITAPISHSPGGVDPWAMVTLTAAADSPGASANLVISATNGTTSMSASVALTEEACHLATCASAGAVCGVVPDGCGSTIDCGGCALGNICSGGQCIPPPVCQPATCASKGVECGSTNDGCGGTVACGTCSSGNSCSLNHCCPTGTTWNVVLDQCGGGHPHLPPGG